jgi:hypothetical protein
MTTTTTKFVVCATNVHGDPEVLCDTESQEPEVYFSEREVLAEVALLNADTLGGYYACRLLSGGCLERVGVA